MFDVHINGMAKALRDSGVIQGVGIMDLAVKEVLRGYWQEKIALVWTTDDVKDMAQDLEIPITDEQAQEVLDSVLHHHDPTYGVRWDTIASAIEQWATGGE